MADIETKGKKESPRVDLTAMVDMNFLLLTFFILSTTLSKPKAMEIQMPYTDDVITDDDKNKIKKDVALTVLLSKDHRLYYYEGIGDDPENPPQLEVTYFKNNDGIRDVLIEKKNSVQNLISQGVLTATDKPTVIIKPDSNSTTDDLINILDEMTINAIPIYAVVDITDVDREYIELTEESNPE